MMAVGCSPEAAKALMAETNLGAQLTVACVNSRSNVTLSGDVEALEALRVVLEERSVFARRLKVEVAYHSSHIPGTILRSFVPILACSASWLRRSFRPKALSAQKCRAWRKANACGAASYAWRKSHGSATTLSETMRFSRALV